MMKTTRVVFVQNVMKITYWLGTKNANARKKLFVVFVLMDSERFLKNAMWERMKILAALVVRFKEGTFVKRFKKEKTIVFLIAETVF